MRVAIITNGSFPVPASKGGAVENLIENLIKENETGNRAEFTLFSIYDKDATERAEKYDKTEFVFIKANSLSRFVDGVLHFFAYNIFKSKRHLAFKTIFQRLDYLYQVARLIHSENYDKIVIENQLASLLVFKYKNNQVKYKDKFYFHLHNHPAKYMNLDILKDCRKVISVSEFIGSRFAENINYQYKKDQLCVVKNMVDEKLFDPQNVDETYKKKIKQELGLSEERIVLFSGRLIPGKGVKELLEAFDQCDLEKTVLVIVGSFNYNFAEKSPYEIELESLIRKIGTDRVKFTGYVKQELIPNYYSIADVVVLPSTCEEAAGLTMIETQMMHKPLITTSMGGIPEYIGDGAILLNNDSNLVTNLSSSIQKVLNDDVYRNEMIENSIRASGNWSLSRFYNDFIDSISD